MRLGLEPFILPIVNSLHSFLSSPGELALVKRRLLAEMSSDQETDEGLAHALGYADIVGGEMPEALKARIQTTTSSEIAHFADQFLNITHCLVVRVAPNDLGQAAAK